MTIPLSHIHERAKTRPPGYIEDVLASGVVNGDQITIDDEAFARLVAKYNPPSPLSMAGGLVKSLVAWASAGFPTVDESTLQERSAQCAICPRWDARAGRCLECGCAGLKHWLATERCPLGRW